MMEIKPKKRIRFSINMRPITKKNSQTMRMNTKTGRFFPAPSAAYQRYERDARWFIPAIKTIETPVNVRGLFYMPTRGIVDLVNLEEALLDVLVKYGVLKDDNCRIVVSMDGSRVLYDKENPRTEVEIEYED